MRRESSEEFDVDNDPQALSRRRMANARWRSWSIEKNLNSYNTEEPSSNERLGVSRASPKAWEQFHQRFLDNLAETQLQLATQTRSPDNAAREASAAPLEERHSASEIMLGCETAGPVTAFTPAFTDGIGGSSSGGGAESSHAGASEKSVRSGQLFGDMFKAGHHTALYGIPEGGSALSAALTSLGPQRHVSEGGVGAEDGPMLRRQPHVVPEVDSRLVTGGGAPVGGHGPSGSGRTVAYYQQDYVDKMLRMHFTEFHNSNRNGTKNDNASAFLGDELSVHHNNYFGAYFGGGGGSNSRGMTPPEMAGALHHHLQGRLEHSGRSPPAGPGFVLPQVPRRSAGERASTPPQQYLQQQQQAASRAMPPPTPKTVLGSSPSLVVPAKIIQQQQQPPAAAAAAGHIAAAASAPAALGVPPAIAAAAAASWPSVSTASAPIGASSTSSAAAAAASGCAAASSPSEPVFLPVKDASSWSPNKRHWILPAVIAAFPEALLSTALRESPRVAFGNLAVDTLSGSRASSSNSLSGMGGGSENGGSMSASPNSGSGSGSNKVPYDPFRSVELGCVSVVQEATSGPLERWRTRWLVLRQNYLFEYATQETAQRRPLGFANLHLAHVATAALDPCVLRLEFLTTPAEKSERVVVLLRAPTPALRSGWLSLLRRASNLEMGDLYELVPGSALDGGNAQQPPQPPRSNSPVTPTGAELGRGRFTCVKRGRRRPFSSNGRKTLAEALRGPNSDSGNNLAARAAAGAAAVAAAGAVDTCALKIVDKSVFFDRVADGKERQDTLVREVLSQAVLTARSGELERCTIVRLYSIFETSERLVLEVELMSGVDLFDKLSTSGVLCDRDAAGLVRNVLQAVKFCLANDFAHRDVKLSNLIYPSGDHTQNPANVKLADFGMAGRIGEDQMLHGRCGTPGYVAPEILHAGVNEGYPANVDTFSVGVVAYTVLCGYEPFYGVNERQLIAANKAAEYEFHNPEWASIGKDARDLVSKLLQKDPAKRLTADEALQHPWIVKHYPPGSSTERSKTAENGGCVVT